MRGIDFYSNCVSLNRPCKVPEMAKTWKASKDWKYSNKGLEYLGKGIFGDRKVPVFLDDVPPVDADSYENYSFDEESKKSMSFNKEFLGKLKKRTPATMRFKTKSIKDSKFFEKDIEYPSFYHDLAEFAGTEVIMG